jgi:hypothetical protein
MLQVFQHGRSPESPPEGVAADYSCKRVHTPKAGERIWARLAPENNLLRASGRGVQKAAERRPDAALAPMVLSFRLWGTRPLSLSPLPLRQARAKIAKMTSAQGSRPLQPLWLLVLVLVLAGADAAPTDDGASPDLPDWCACSPASRPGGVYHALSHHAHPHLLQERSPEHGWRGPGG